MSEICQLGLDTFDALGSLVLVLFKEVLLLAGPNDLLSFFVIGFNFDNNLDWVGVCSFRDNLTVGEYVSNAFGCRTQFLQSSIAVAGL